MYVCKIISLNFVFKKLHKHHIYMCILFVSQRYMEEIDVCNSLKIWEWGIKRYKFTNKKLIVSIIEQITFKWSGIEFDICHLKCTAIIFESLISPYWAIRSKFGQRREWREWWNLLKYILFGIRFHIKIHFKLKYKVYYKVRIVLLLSACSGKWCHGTVRRIVFWVGTQINRLLNFSKLYISI